MPPEQVHGQGAFCQALLHDRLHIARQHRQRRIGEDNVAAFEQFAADAIPLILDVGGRRRQIDPLPLHPWRGRDKLASV